MARDFTKNTANYMRLGINAIAPLLNGKGAFSAHCWFNVDTLDTATNTDNRLFQVYVANGSSGFIFCIDATPATDVFKVGARSGSGDGFQTKSATSACGTGVWHSGGAVVDIAGDAITPYFNGVAEGGGAVTFGNATFTNGTPTTSFDAVGSDGAVAASQQQTDGRIAEMAIWTEALTAIEFAYLAKGYAPFLVHNKGLIFYMPLIGVTSPEPDIVSAKLGTITGTVAAAAHPPIHSPSFGDFSQAESGLLVPMG